MAEHCQDASKLAALTAGLPGDVAFYLELARAAVPPVIDLGCGAGRVTIPLARAGIAIAGLDRSRPMLRIARREASGLDCIDWIQGDMRGPPLRSGFGLAILPYRGFQHLLSRDDQTAALNATLRLLRPGGRFALNIFNPGITGLLTRGRSSVQSRQPSIFSRTEPGLRLRYVFRAEMEELLLASGFKIEALYGWFDRRPFDECCTEMIWLARRPEGSASAEAGFGS